MAVTNSDLKWYHAQQNNDAGYNGGPIGSEEIVNNTKNNLFPDVTQEELASGITRLRKIFLKNTNATDTLDNLVFYLEDVSPADDYFAISRGTDTDIQMNIDASYRWYGAGVLTQDFSAGVTNILVMPEGDEELFKTGDTIVIINKDTGQFEFHDNVYVVTTTKPYSIT